MTLYLVSGLSLSRLRGTSLDRLHEAVLLSYFYFLEPKQRAQVAREFERIRGRGRG